MVSPDAASGASIIESSRRLEIGGEGDGHDECEDAG